jgi:hypothetical protein
MKLPTQDLALFDQLRLSFEQLELPLLEAGARRVLELPRGQEPRDQEPRNDKEPAPIGADSSAISGMSF